MQILFGDYKKVNSAGGTAVAIGNFDGLHKGHQKILKTLKEAAHDLGIPSVVYTFSEHPINIIRVGLKLICTNRRKEELMENEKIHTLFFDEFKNVRDLSPEEFVRDILVEKLNIKVAVIGKTGKFGRNSSGDAETLQKLGEKYGFSVMVADAVAVYGTVCSSTEIRKKLENGEMDKANELLGYRYSIDGIVKGDKHLGRTYGYPTANIFPDEALLLPKCGVYATNVIFDGKSHKAITNVGTTSFDTDGKVKVESHILDYSGNLYDKTIRVEFLYYLRDFKNFINTEELKLQLDEDKKTRKLEG